MERTPQFTRSTTPHRSTHASSRQGYATPPHAQAGRQSRATIAHRDPVAPQRTMPAPQPMRSQSREPMQPQHEARRSAWILDKVIAVCVWMLFFGLPLFFLSVTYQGIAFEKQYYFYTWTFIGVVAFVVRSMMGAASEIRRTPLDVPLAALLFAVVLSALFSVDRYHSAFGFFGTPVMGMVSLVATVMAYYLIVSTMTRERIVQVWWAIVTSGAAVILWSFAATMRLIGQDVLAIVPGTLTGSFSGLTIYLGMLLPFLILAPSVIGSARTKLVTIFTIALIAINGLTLSALYGYAQWYVILGVVGLLVVFMVSRLVQSAQQGMGTIIGVFLALMFLFLWGQPLVTRIAIQPEPIVTTALSWTVAKGALGSRPLLGSGPGTYGYQFSLFTPQDVNKDGNYDTRVFAGRGMIMDGIATLGVVGVVALCSVFFTYIGTAWMAFLRGTQDDVLKVAALGFFVASLAAAVYSLLWAIDGVVILYGAILAAACVGSVSLLQKHPAKTWALTLTSSPQHALSFAFLSIVAAVLAVFGFVTLGKMFAADVYAKTALTAYQKNDNDRTMTAFQKAITLNGQEGRYYTLVAQYGLDLATREANKPTDQQNRDALAMFITQAAGAANFGCDLMPNDVLAHEVKGIVLENSGGYVQGAASEALAAYGRAGMLEPHNPQLDLAVGRMQLAQAQTKTGDQATQERQALVEEAKKSFDAAKNKTTFTYGNEQVSLFAPAHYYLAMANEALGKIDDAIAAMSMALGASQATAGVTPSDAVQTQSINYAFHLARMLQIRNADGDRAQAEKILQNIIALREKDVGAMVELGLLYERDDKKDAAIAQYKKVLTFLAEEDTQSRDMVQKMIDTVQDGGSNVPSAATSIEGAASENATHTIVEPVQEENVPDATSQASPMMPRTVIVHDTASADNAAKGGDLLRQNGYEDVDMRSSENASNGVTVMYRDDAHAGAAESVAAVLRAQFSEVTIMRNDGVLASYADFDILVDMGQDVP